MNKIVRLAILYLAMMTIMHSALAFHDTEISYENIALLGGVYSQVFAYEQGCPDHQYYSSIMERLPQSPRFTRYNAELDHLSDRQQAAWERGGVGFATGVSTGMVNCDTMAQVIWEWFGER